MEQQTIWFLVFAISLLAMIFCSGKAGKNAVEDLDEKVEKMPIWQRWAYGILDIYPYNLLNPKGKKWQNLMFALLIPTLLSGYKVGLYISV